MSSESENPRERPENEDESLQHAAEADDTSSPGSEPGGPEYPEEATEGREA